MKILHYIPGLPPVRGGGLIKYALDLAEAQSGSGNAVAFLMPGPISIKREKRCRIKIQKKGLWKDIKVFKIHNPLPIPMANGILDIEEFTMPCMEGVYRDFLNELQPDLIHVHSLMGIHREFLSEAGELMIPVIFTTHDYFGLCPTVNLLYRGEICSQPWMNCEECSCSAFSEKRLLLEQSTLYRIYRKNSSLIRLLQKDALKHFMAGIRSNSPEERKCVTISGEGDGTIDRDCAKNSEKIAEYKKLREYYYEMFGNITFFHFNSDISRRIYERHLGSLPGQVIGISNRSVRDRRILHESKGKLKIGFVGGDIAFKGLQRLQKAVDELYNNGMSEIELQVYGSLVRERYPFCTYYDSFSETERDQVFARMDLLAVPSSWMETFGMVVLEALSYGVPVIVTETVGAKRILEHSSLKLGIVLPDTHEAWKECIEDIYLDRKKVRYFSENIGKEPLDLDYMEHVDQVECLYKRCIRHNERMNGNFSTKLYLNYRKE